MSHDVFISYSSVDKAAADAACANFEAAGIRCWIAPRDVAAGAEWGEAIINAIDRAKVMVLIFSAHANESRQVRREIELAVNRGLTIMPLRLEQIEPTRSMAYYMAGVHWIDALTPPLETHFRKMAEWIKPLLQDRAAPVEAPAVSTAAPPVPASADVSSPAIDELAKLAAQAQALWSSGRDEDALVIFRELIARAGDGPDPLFREQVALAYYNMGLRLSKLGRLDDAIAAFDEVIGRFGTSTEPLLRVPLAASIYSRGTNLGKAGRHERALAAYHEVITRFEQAPEPSLREYVAMAQFASGSSLGALGRMEPALAAYAEVALRFGSAKEPAIRKQVAMSIFNTGARLGYLGRWDEAIAAYDRVIGEYADISDHVAKAMLNKAVALRDLGQSDKAAAVANALFSRFGADPNPVVQAEVAKARTIWAETPAGLTTSK